MIVIGIDPGKTGGIALLGPDPCEAIVSPMLPAGSFARMLLLNPDCHVFIEKAQSMPKQGIVSAFTYGQHFGELLGVIAALNIAHTLVPPRTWSRVMHAGTGGGTTKERSREAVQRLFPGVSLALSPKAKKPHLGMVEALLIAEYGRRVLAGKE